MYSEEHDKLLAAGRDLRDVSQEKGLIGLAKKPVDFSRLLFIENLALQCDSS